MFDFLHTTEIEKYKDIFLYSVGVIISYSPIKDFTSKKKDITSFLTGKGYKPSAGHTSFFIKKDAPGAIKVQNELCAFILSGDEYQDFGSLDYPIKVMLELLPKLGVSQVQPYIRRDDQFNFKEGTNVTEHYSEIKHYLLSKDLIKVENSDTYQITENDVSLNIEFEPDQSNHSCFLRIFALSTEYLNITSVADKIGDMFDAILRAWENTISVEVKNILKEDKNE